MSMKTAERYHDISCGHRVYGHESKCAHLHGHNYRIRFVCVADLDKIGRVIDFSAMNRLLCMFLEQEWDHRTLIYQEDPWVNEIMSFDPEGLVIVTFNPTAENIADHLLKIQGPRLLEGTGVVLTKVTVEETRKCAASATLSGEEFVEAVQKAIAEARRPGPYEPPRPPSHHPMG